jgi:fructosamine-3-kinase
MILNQEIRKALVAELGEQLRDVQRVGGGCIAEAVCVETRGNRFFVKSGDPSVARTFEAEAAGLKELADAAHVVRVPDVYAVRLLANGTGFLLMEWIDEGSPQERSWRDLGQGLAEIHGTIGSTFGFEQDNFIGATPQSNRRSTSWPQFFREERLAAQVALARSSGLWDASWDACLERLYARLEECLPERPPPALVHGDLWRGNVLADRSGRPVLIDPAAYRGHSEVDIAMSRLFGSFPDTFYAAYDDALAPEAGRRERESIYNLYHLINHLNLFGGSYAASVRTVLARF